MLSSKQKHINALKGALTTAVVAESFKEAIKHGDHDQSAHNPGGGMGATSSPAAQMETAQQFSDEANDIRSAARSADNTGPGGVSPDAMDSAEILATEAEELADDAFTLAAEAENAGENSAFAARDQEAAAEKLQQANANLNEATAILNEQGVRYER